MINQQLLDYIKQQLQRGASQEQIKNSLMASGWRESDVNEVFSSVSNVSSHQSQAPIPQQTVASLPSATALLGQAWIIYKQRMGVFLGIMIIPMVIMIGFVVTMGSYGFLFKYLVLAQFAAVGYGLFIALMLLLILVFTVGMLWGQTSLLYAIKDSQEGIGIKESYRRGWHKIVSYWWISILAWFIILGGFLLLIAPGIIFWVWFSLAIYILISEDVKGMDALLKSREYVKGHWGGVFWRLIFMSALYLIIYFIPVIILDFIEIPLAEQISQFIVGLFLAPLFTIYLFLVYSNLKAIKDEFVSAPTRGKRLPYVFIAILGFLVIPAMLFATVFFSLNTARYRARDAKRIADLKQLQVALELYYDESGSYPLTLNELSPRYIAVPVDPKTNNPYDYQRQGETDYKICAQLEDKTEKCFSSQSQ